MAVLVRKEKEEDYGEVEKLVELAFADIEYSSKDEHHLVNKLRNSTSFLPDLSLVAVLDNKIVGHILLTKNIINLGDEEIESLSLAPVSVLPEYQKKGVGSVMIKTSLNKARELGFNSVIVMGHSEYYPRFGFEPSKKFNINCPDGIPQNVFMALELVPNALSAIIKSARGGDVVYPPEFGL